MGKTITDQECCCLPDILCNLCLDDNAMEWARVTFEGIVHRAGEDPCGSSDVPPCPGGDCSLLNGTYLLHGTGGTSDCCRWGFQSSNNDDTYPPCHCGDSFELKLCCSEEETLEWELWIDITTSGYVVAYIDWDQEEACEVIGDPGVGEGLPGVDCTEPLEFPEFLEFPMINPPKVLTCDFSNATATVQWGRGD